MGSTSLGEVSVSEGEKGRLLFPWLERQEQRVLHYNSQHPRNKLVSAVNFIQVLKYFEKDSCPRLPNSSRWHIPGRSAAGYRGEVRAAAQETVTQREAMLQHQRPVTSAEFDSLKHDITSKLDSFLIDFIRSGLVQVPLDELERRAGEREEEHVTPPLERVLRVTVQQQEGRGAP